MKLSKTLFLILLMVPNLLWSQDPREYNHGTVMIPYESGDSVKYYLSWSSSARSGWEHDIYRSIVFFDKDGQMVTEVENQKLIATTEAQEPIHAAINPRNNYILSAWEDGDDAYPTNVRAQLHTPYDEVIKPSWIIAGGKGSQHSAKVAHLGNKFLVFYADEAPPATKGAVVKSKVINDRTGKETQSIRFTPNNEDHWWPATISNKSNTRTLIVWGNDGYAAMGTVLYEEDGEIKQVKSPQNYLTNIQQYYYEVDWLEEISQFILIARHGSYENSTDSSRICLIDTIGNISTSVKVNGGIIREAQMISKWNDCNQSYSVLFPTEENDLTMITIDRNKTITKDSIVLPPLDEIKDLKWSSTGISGRFVQSYNRQKKFNDQFKAFFVMNDLNSNDLIKTTISLDDSLFCGTGTSTESNLREQEFHIYPNPASTHITVPEEAIGQTYEILSMKGKRLQHGIFRSTTIPVFDLPPNIYILKIQNSERNEVLYSKFVKK